MRLWKTGTKIFIFTPQYILITQVPTSSRDHYANRVYLFLHILLVIEPFCCSFWHLFWHMYLFEKVLFDRFREWCSWHEFENTTSRQKSKMCRTFFYICEKMCVKKYSFPTFMQFMKYIFHETTTDRVETTHGLIEKYNLWIMKYRLSESYTFEHTLWIGRESRIFCITKIY